MRSVSIEDCSSERIPEVEASVKGLIAYWRHGRALDD